MTEKVLLKEEKVLQQRRDREQEFGTLILTSNSLVFEKTSGFLSPKKEVSMQLLLNQISEVSATPEPTRMEKILATANEFMSVGGSYSIIPLPTKKPSVLSVVVQEAGYDVEYLFVVKKATEWAKKILEAKNAVAGQPQEQT